MAKVSTYDADQILQAWGGIVIDSGYADGTFAKVTYDAKAFTYKVGTDGTVTRSKTKNKVTLVTFSLMQSSNINDLLSAALNIDLLASNGAGIAPYSLKDLNGTTAIGAPHAWLEQFPEMEFDREATQRDWTLVLADANIFQGSNPNL